MHPVAFLHYFSTLAHSANSRDLPAVLDQHQFAERAFELATNAVTNNQHQFDTDNLIFIDDFLYFKRLEVRGVATYIFHMLMTETKCLKSETSHPWQCQPVPSDDPQVCKVHVFEPMWKPVEVTVFECEPRSDFNEETHLEYD